MMASDLQRGLPWTAVDIIIGLLKPCGSVSVVLAYIVTFGNGGGGGGVIDSQASQCIPILALTLTLSVGII